jgi:RNase P/RNase MRP subunit p29
VVTTTDKDVFVEVKTDSGTKVGKAQITVVMPTITFNPSPLTYLFKETVNVTITDPVTGDPIKADLELDGEELYATITGTGVKNHLDDEAVFGYELTTTAGSKSEYTFDLVVVPVDENKDVETSLTITEIDIYGGAVLTVEIPVRFGSATLNLDNKNLYIGANNKVTFTLTNARGEGLAERTIFQGSQDIGTTGENGTMMFNVQPAATGKITFKASTDAERDDKDQYVVAEAFANQDLRGPVINITVPEKTSESRVTISGTITDETRVQSVYVNNLPVAIVPGPSTIFVYELELRDGANPFNIIALDANGNGTPFIGTITRVAPEPPPAPKTVSVTIGKVDIAAGLDVAAYLEPGRTMVPLAFISRTLGGTAEWDAATNSVTIRLTGKVAVLTFGSKTAVVNGTAMTLYVAPTPKSGRTFVALADLAKLLGAQTSWNEATRTATVILP